MRLVIAVIPLDKLDDVRQALLAIEVGHLCVTRATGHGRFGVVSSDDAEIYRGVEHVPALTPKARIELCVLRERVEGVIDVITRASRQSSGNDDGFVFVLPVDEVVRLPAGERGRRALGEP